MSAQFETYENPAPGKSGHCWQLVVDGQVVAVAPSYYQTKDDMLAALNEAKGAFAGAEVVDRPY